MIRILRSAVLVGCAFIATQAYALAAEVSFSASVDKTKPAVGERLNLSFVLKNAGMGGGEDLRLPDLSDFYVLSGPNQSSSFEFVNGRMSSSVTYSYILQPKSEGNYTIGSASIVVDGKTYSSRPIRIDVLQSKPPRKQQKTERSGTDDQIADNIFLEAFVDRKRTVRGEQITLTYKIYTRFRLNDYAIHKAPTLTGFWSEDLQSGEIVDVKDEVVDGRQFTTGIVRQIALFPTQTGELVINPMELQVLIQVKRGGRRDPFESLFKDPLFRDPFGRTAKYILRSNPVTVTVDPLPEGAPDDFKGAVGKYRMDVSIDKSRVKTGEPVSLKVSISGEGNIKLLEAPEIELPPGIESYPPKVTDKIERRDTTVSGTKTFEYLLIPRIQGSVRLAPIRYSFFDPSVEKYSAIKSSSYEFQVEPSAYAAAGGSGEISRMDVELLSKDIRFIKLTDLDLKRRGDYLFNHPLFITLVIFPFLGFIGVLIYGKRVKRSRGNIALFRKRRASKNAQRGFKEVRRVIQADQTEEFYGKLSQVMWSYIGDMLNIEPGEYSLDKTKAFLTGQGISTEIVDLLHEILETCSMASYSPGSADKAAMEEIFGKGKDVVNKLDRELQ